jgi:Putative prokaryotic signal transducing protein
MWKCSKCGQKVDDSYEICWACGTTVDGVENPHFLEEVNWSKEKPAGPESDVAPESLVTLTKCSLPPQAHAIRVRLESEGIPVFLFDEFTITMDWLLSNAIGGVKVQVPEPYLERARAIMGIVEQEEAEEEEHDDEDEESADDAPRRQLEEGIMDMELHEGIRDKELNEGITDKDGNDSKP